MSAVIATVAGISENSVPSYIARGITIVACGFAYYTALTRRATNRLDPWMTALYLMYTFRLVWDLLVEGTPGADVALVMFVFTCALPAAAIAGSSALWDDEAIARGLLVSGLFICGGSFLLRDSFYVANQSVLESTGRLQLGKLNPITIGHAGATTMIASLLLWTTSRSRFWQLGSVPAAAAGAYLTILAASRGPILAAGVCILSFLIARRMWKYLAILGGALFLAVSVYAAIDFTAFLEQTRLSGAGTDESSDDRLRLYAMAVSEIQEHWMFGSSFTLPMGEGWPHNVTIESWLAMGVFGFALWMLLCGRGLIAALTTLDSPGTMAALIFLQYLVAAQFSGALWGGWPGLWLGMAFLLAVGYKGQQRRL